MKILAKEKLSEHKVKTPEGYLICMDSVIARTGPQQYYKSELFDTDAGDDEMISVDRKPEQVFAPETIASFENKPLTDEHPDMNVTPLNYKDLSVGYVRDVHKGQYDGQDVMLANLVVTDPTAISDIENGIRTDLSCGYDCDITEGDHPEQINIRGNHVALCEQGRAGIAKIVDSVPPKKAKESEIDYRHYKIMYNFDGDGKYMIWDAGDDITFDTLDEAKRFVDDEIDKNRNMLRDHAIASEKPIAVTKASLADDNAGVDTYSPEFKQKLNEFLENKLKQLDAENGNEILDDEIMKRYNHQRQLLKKVIYEIINDTGKDDEGSGD
jgi:hypothetical protein